MIGYASCNLRTITGKVDISSRLVWVQRFFPYDWLCQMLCLLLLPVFIRIFQGHILVARYNLLNLFPRQKLGWRIDHRYYKLHAIYDGWDALDQYVLPTTSPTLLEFTVPVGQSPRLLFNSNNTCWKVWAWRTCRRWRS